MASEFELQYRNLLEQCLLDGEPCENRTAHKTYKVFNKSLNINLRDGFPIITGKKIFFEKALAEFRWIYNGQTNLEYLHDNNIFWWDEFAIAGSLGKVYGYQIRHFNGVFDQIKYCINELKNNSRRAVISLWNPCDLEDQALPCCYTFRSSDLFLGLPYDIIVGALFLHTVAIETNLEVHTLGINLADAHIYFPHVEAVLKYCNNAFYNLPELSGNFNSYSLKDYNSKEFIKAQLIK
jgi:thymidylate synthase